MAGWIEDLAGYKNALNDGSDVAQRSKINGTGTLSFVDNAVSGRTDAVLIATTVAALSAAPGAYDGQEARAECHTTRGGGGGGSFVWDDDSAATADGGTVLGTGTGRWLRVFDGKTYTPEMFGAIGDGATNDGAALQAALTAVPAGGKLVLDREYLSNQALTRSASIEISGTGTIKRGTTTGALLTISGTIGTYIEFARVKGITVDGDDAGSIVYGSPYAYDLRIQYVNRPALNEVRFINTRYNSAYIVDCGHLNARACSFIDGVFSAGAVDSTTAFHLQLHNVDSYAIDDCTWSYDGAYDPGVYSGASPQQAVVSCAPTAIFSTSGGRGTITNCKTYNAGAFDIYDGAGTIVISGCEAQSPQMPAFKIHGFMRASVQHCVVTAPQHYWGSSIYLGSYARVDTYGSLDQYQGVATVANNQIYGTKSREGAISHIGALFSTTNLDTRIIADNAAGRTTNRVDKVGSDYFYTDRNGVQGPAIDQEYFKARSCTIGMNIIDGFATYGINTYLVKNVKVRDNVFPKGAEVDTVYTYNKGFIVLTEFDHADVDDNTLQMSTTDVPKISTVAAAVNGITLSCTAVTTSVGTAKCKGNTIKLNECGAAISLLDMHSANVEGNTMKLLSFFSTGSGFIKSVGGIIRKGRVSGNIRSLDDTGTTPSASSLYLFEQGGFLSCEKLDETYTVTPSRRVVAGAAAYTTPQQVASGYYPLGGQIVVDAFDKQKYYRCETAGYLAPAYAGGTAYTRGEKVVSGGEYFVALQATTGNTPTAGTGDAYWEYLSATASTWLEYTL